MDLLVFNTRDVYRLKALSAAAIRDGMTSLAELDGYLQHEIDRRERSMQPAGIEAARSDEQICPSCGRFVMTKPKGSTEPVLVCPSCHYSEYRGVR